MSQASTLSVKPIIHYPRVAQVGKTYLMTIDLQIEKGLEWQNGEEEYPVYCKVDSDLFSSKPIGEPVIVLHRFNGSYGKASFLLTSIFNPGKGTIRIVLINSNGVPFKILDLEEILLQEFIVQDPEKFRILKYLNKSISE